MYKAKKEFLWYKEGAVVDDEEHISQWEKEGLVEEIKEAPPKIVKKAAKKVAKKSKSKR